MPPPHGAAALAAWGRRLAANHLMAQGSTAVYLYCVVRAARRPSLARVPAGLPGAGRPQAHRLSRRAVARHGRRSARRLRPGAARAAAARSRLGVAGRASRTKRWSNTSRGRRPRSSCPMKLFTMFSSLDKATADVASRRRGRSSGRCGASPAARNGASACSRAARRRRRRRPARASGVGRRVPARAQDRRATPPSRHRDRRDRGRRRGVRALRRHARDARSRGRAGRSRAAIRRFSTRRFW